MPFSSNKTSCSSSFIITNVESCDMWHAILGHIKLNSIRRMMSLNLIPKSSIDLKNNVKYVFNQSNQENLSIHA